MDKEFCIYSDRNQLQTPSITEYRVEELLKPKELKPSIKLCKEELDFNGTQSIIKNFDKLFSFIELMDQMEYQDLHYVYEEILVKNLNMIASFFSSYGTVEDVPSDLRHQYITIIKMSVYLFVEFALSFYKKIETDYKMLLLETKGRNKIQDLIQKHTSDYDWNWENKLCDGFNAINSIISNNITQLYNPPYVDRIFVSYIAASCYTQLENANIAFVRNTPLRDSIMQILVILVTDYDHAHDFKIQIVRLMKSYEHLPVHLAKTVLEVIESDVNRSSLIELIVKEIALRGEMESIKDISHQNISGGKSYCSFLVEIAKHAPKLLLLNIKHLLPSLESDPYTMRICVLSVLKELIVHILNHDELDDLGRKTRDDYLFIIRDHLLDINAYVRSKALQLLTAIINENCLPKNMFRTILKSAEEKLHDKSSYVTKSAIQLIKTLIKSNPYSFDFTENKLKDKLKKENCILKNMEQVLEEKINSGMSKEEKWSLIEQPLKLFLDDILENSSLESFSEPELLKDMDLCDVILNIKNDINLHKFNVVLKFVLCGKETFKDEPLFKLQEEGNSSEQLFLLIKNIWWYKNTQANVSIDIKDFECMSAEKLNQQISLIESKISYLQECAEYLNTIKKSLNTIKQLMLGNILSVSIEAIDFFTTAFQFGVPDTQTGIDAMISLIYSPDNNIKQAMINSYKTIYLSSDESMDSTAQATTIMTKLINLLKTLNITNRKAFKTLLKEWISNSNLENDWIMILWAWFTKSIIISDDDRVFTALLISLLASSKPSIAQGNIDNLVHYGLCSNYQLFIYSCEILLSISQEDFQRFSENGEMVNRVLNVIETCFNEGNVKIFNDVAAYGINVIYKLTIKPDATCSNLIMKFHSFVVNNKHDPIDNEETIEVDAIDNEETIEVDPILFSKFIFIVGHIALQQYNHLEDYVANELIRRVRCKYDAKRSKMDKNMKEECIHDYEAVEIDGVNDRIQHICKKHLVTGNGFLSSFTEEILNACSSDNSDIKVNAVITLIKFMTVSELFCKENLPLFIDLLENSDNLETCIDLISGFGSLIFKHPNLLEPFTDKLYGRLNDKRIEVRYSALMIIIGLIRQEMIKVKSQVAGIAKLLVDEDEKIKSLAIQFFGILTGKGNTLYNVLSDIISILSNPEDYVSETDFQKIMKFLIPLISKERQIEALVDKLCSRLKGSNNDIQAYYISYCLMIIKYTEKSLVKLSDNLPYYSDKLKNIKVYINFITLISTNSRMAKSATKNILTELSDKIEKIVEDNEFTIPLSLKTPGKRLFSTTKKKQAKSTTKKICNEDEKVQLKSVTKQTNKSRIMVNNSLIEENEETCEIDDNEVNVFKQNKRQNKLNNSSLCIVKKKAFKKTTKENIENETESVVTKQTLRSHSKTKKKQVENDNDANLCKPSTRQNKFKN